jgi:cell shape-determining protein MreD
MIRHATIAALACLAMVLDAGSSRWSLPEGTAPHFLCLAASVSLLLCEGSGAVIWCALIGFLVDALSNGPLGLNVILLANLAFFAQLSGTFSSRHSAFASAGVVWGFGTLALLGNVLLKALLSGAAIDLVWMSRYAGGRAGAGVALFLGFVLSCKLLAQSFRLVIPSTRVGTQQRGWLTSRSI